MPLHYPRSYHEPIAPASASYRSLRTYHDAMTATPIHLPTVSVLHSGGSFYHTIASVRFEHWSLKQSLDLGFPKEVRIWADPVNPSHDPSTEYNFGLGRDITISVHPREFPRDFARVIWNHLIELGFHP